MSSVTDGSSNPSGEPQRPCTANDASNPAAASSHLHPLTFWCHECDMSVSIHPSSHSPFLCPDCFRCDSLVPLDYPLPPFISLRSLRQPSSHLAPTTNRSIAAADVDSDADILDLPPRPVPATKESISSIPTIEIAEQSVLCAICKDDLPRGSSARLLPCSHLYHSDCIVSWLSLRNSCPLCRSPIACSGRSQTPRYRLRIFEPEDEERINLEASIRQILQVRVAMAVEVSPSQIGMDEIGSMGSASSGETVSSDWPVGSVWGAGRRLMPYSQMFGRIFSTESGEHLIFATSVASQLLSQPLSSTQNEELLQRLFKNGITSCIHFSCARIYFSLI